MKRQSLFILAFFIFIIIPVFINKTKLPEKTLYVSTHFGTIQTAKQTFNKRKPVILWDLHEVLFDTSRSNFMNRGLWNVENKPKFFFQFTKTLINPRVWKIVHYQTDHNIRVTQSYLDATLGYDHLHTELIKFSNNIYTPNKHTYNVVNELHAEGCKQYLFSNIGPTLLKDLQTTYPQYFTSFEQLQNTINPTTPPYKEWVQKPEILAFNKMLNTISMHNKPWMTIFIDDQECNVKKAHEMGMNGIIFISHVQLQKDINQLMELNSKNI